MSQHMNPNGSGAGRQNASDACGVNVLTHADFSRQRREPLQGLSSQPLTSDKPSHTQPKRELTWHGTRSKLIVRFATVGNRSEILALQVRGLGPSGEELVTYEMTRAPSASVSDAIVRLLKSLPRNVNIDRYLSDFGGLIRADRGNSIELVHPKVTGATEQIYPMVVEAPPFSDFSANPAALADRWLATWRKGSLQFEVRGLIEAGASQARLEVSTLSDHGSEISSVTYEVPTQRDSFADRRERHNHLRARIWEAIDLAYRDGTEAVGDELRLWQDSSCGELSESGHGEPVDTTSTFSVTQDDDEGPLKADEMFEIYVPKVGGEIAFKRISSGGAAVVLEVAHSQAAICVSAPLETCWTTAVFVLESEDRGSPIQETEVERLKSLVADLTSRDPSVRKRALRDLDQKAVKSGYTSDGVRELYSAPLGDHGDAVDSAWRPHQTTRSITEWLLDGYHPVFLDLWSSARLDPFACNFFKLALGVNATGDLRVEFRHEYDEGFVALIPAVKTGALAVAKERVQSIVGMFYGPERDSWEKLLSCVQSFATNGGKSSVRYEPSPEGLALPPLEDPLGITALSLANEIAVTCRGIHPLVDARSFRAYTGQGEATAYIRYKNTPVMLGIRVRGDMVVGISCHEVSPEEGLAIPKTTVVHRRVHFSSQEPEKVVRAALSFSETFADALQDHEIERSAHGRSTPLDTRALFMQVVQSRAPRKAR